MLKKKLLKNKRLKAILNLTDANLNIADIGADHGNLAIELAKISKQVFATEYHSAPFLRLQQKIDQENVDNIIVLQGDGFNPLPKQTIDLAIVAGMGGKIISDMIARFPNIATLILAPQNNSAIVRSALKKYNYQIIKEIILKEKGLYYNIIKAIKSNTTNIIYRKDILIGPVFEKNLIVKEFLEEKLNRLNRINKHRQDKNIYQDILEIEKILKSW